MRDGVRVAMRVETYQSHILEVLGQSVVSLQSHFGFQISQQPGKKLLFL